MDLRLLMHLEKVRRDSEKMMRAGDDGHTAFLFSVHDALDFLGAQIDAEKAEKAREPLTCKHCGARHD